MKKLLGLGVAGALALAIAVGVGSAATGYSLFGDATIVTPGNASGHAVQASTSTSPNYGGVDFGAPSGLTINQLNNLATDYQFTAGSCGLGSPRFGIQLSGYPGTIFAYLGPPPNYTGCPPNVWSNSGNLVTPASLVDTSQLPGGTFYDTWAAAQARYSGATVTDIFLVLDAPADTTAQFDNTQINGTTYTYEPVTPASAADCKNGGWKNVTRADGSAFKNQGDCIQYVNTGK